MGISFDGGINAYISDGRITNKVKLITIELTGANTGLKAMKEDSLKAESESETRRKFERNVDMSETNDVETSPVDRIFIPPSAIGGWKSSAVFSVIYFMVAVSEILNGNVDAALGFFVAGCGWIGWAIQEMQHLKGYIIKDL